MRIRAYKTRDTEEIVKLCYDTVHEVNIHDYTKAQTDAWAPETMNLDRWTERLSSKFTYVADAVAEQVDGAAEQVNQIICFAGLEENGHIDWFYCHKDFQRKGVGTQLLKQIELKANVLGINKLFVEASITAKPFFEQRGFRLVREQEVELRGQKFINFLMEKFI